MSKLLIFSTKKILKSSFCANIPGTPLTKSSIILANKELTILFACTPKIFFNQTLFTEGQSLIERSFGTNAFSLSKDRHAPVMLLSDEHTDPQYKDLNSLCYPIRRISGEIIGYLGMFIEKNVSYENLLLFLEVLSKSVYQQFCEYRMISKMKTLGFQKNKNSVQLSQSEYSVLELVAQGKNDEEIASLLMLSKSTVRAHMKKLFAKLGVSRRTELVYVYLQMLFTDIVY